MPLCLRAPGAHPLTAQEKKAGRRKRESECMVVSRFGVGYEESITPCFLKREKRGSKLDGDGEVRSQRPERLLPDSSLPPNCDPPGDQNGPAAVWLSLQGKLSVYVTVLTSEEPDGFRVGALNTLPAWGAALGDAKLQPG